MQAISPKEINSHVEKLLQLMKAEYDPEQVNVIIEDGAKQNNCYGNVLDKIKRDGGNIHYGWVIWLGNLICEAEHHAVWEDNFGNFTCITPREQRTDTIMFVPDNDKVYAGISYDNIRINITGNPIIDDYIKLFEINEMLYRKLGKRLNAEQVSLPQIASNLITANRTKLHNIELFYYEGGKLGNNCFCGSIKAYNQCHGKNLVNTAMQEADDAIKYVENYNSRLNG